MRTNRRHPRKPSPTTAAHLDQLLDEALRETFPASDPIAVAIERGARAMVRTFKVGDHVSWNSEAGRVSGQITRVYSSVVTYKGYIHHASEDDPLYQIQSDKTDHVAMHKGGALRRLRR
jgi:hypothetical protein